MYNEVNILALVGPGNNGGDTLIAMCKIADQNLPVSVYLINREGNDDPLVARFNDLGGKTYNCKDDEAIHGIK